MSNEQEAMALMCLLDAVIDKAAMECALKEKLYPPAIFHAQQTSEKASKACLSLYTDYLVGHDYTYRFANEIIPVSGNLEAGFKLLDKNMARLESLCVQSRYSVGPRSIRNRLYPQKKVLEICESSRQFLSLCFEFMEKELKTKLPRETDQLNRFILSKYRVYIDDVDLV